MEYEKLIDKQLYDELLKNEPSLEVLDELIRNGANINAVNNNGDSLFSEYLFYVEEQDINLVKYLINRGADINFMSKNEGITPLYYACCSHSIEAVKLLLENGADPNVVNYDNGASILSTCLRRKSYYVTDEIEKSLNIIVPIINTLEEYGAKPTEDIIRDKYERFITIFPSCMTGLITWRGSVNINIIPKIQDQTVSEFKKWLSLNPDPWYEDDIVYKHIIRTKENIELYNKTGMEFAKEIRYLLEDNISVCYEYVDPQYYDMGKKEESLEKKLYKIRQRCNNQLLFCRLVLDRAPKNSRCGTFKQQRQLPIIRRFLLEDGVCHISGKIKTAKQVPA